MIAAENSRLCKLLHALILPSVNPQKRSLGLQNVLAENSEGNTPLHWACLNGQEQVLHLPVAYIYQHPQDIAPISQGGSSCLLFSGTPVSGREGRLGPVLICCFSLQVIKILMSNGASASAVNE